mmetsp:Transcript_22974/g.74383  ORF Transcript_22974/g.74383 Transcript_22974/m.74383 type:complete len:342 (+) Transcript_22974:402-1427(+)
MPRPRHGANTLPAPGRLKRTAREHGTDTSPGRTSCRRRTHRPWGSRLRRGRSSRVRPSTPPRHWRPHRNGFAQPSSRLSPTPRTSVLVTARCLTVSTGHAPPSSAGVAAALTAPEPHGTHHRGLPVTALPHARRLAGLSMRLLLQLGWCTIGGVALHSTRPRLSRSLTIAAGGVGWMAASRLTRACRGRASSSPRLSATAPRNPMRVRRGAPPAVRTRTNPPPAAFRPARGVWRGLTWRPLTPARGLSLQLSVQCTLEMTTTRWTGIRAARIRAGVWARSTAARPPHCPCTRCARLPRRAWARTAALPMSCYLERVRSRTLLGPMCKLWAVAVSCHTWSVS